MSGLPERFQVSSRYSEQEGINRLYFHVSLDEGHGKYGQIRVRVCWLRTRVTEGENPETYQTIEYHGDYVHANETHLNWFELTAQYNCYPEAGGTGEREPYAIRIGYREEEMNVLEIEKLELRVKFLKWLHGRLEKYEAKYGRITDFARYVNVVAAEMGIQGFICDHPEDAHKSFGKRPYHLYPGDVEGFIRKTVKNGSVLEDTTFSINN